MTQATPATIRNLLKNAVDRLRRGGIDEAQTDAEWLLAHVLGMGRGEMAAEGDRPAGKLEQRRFEEFIARRLNREPVQYITGVTEFYGIELAVDKRVLIPRPETETVVEVALEEFNRVTGHRPQVLDLGTGSGCIAISIARHMKVPGLVWAADISIDAIEVAKENADRAGVRDRMGFLIGDLFKALEGVLGFYSLDLVVSNPPYVGPEEIERLAPEISEYEPVAALATGDDPLRFFRDIISEARDVLRSGGSLVLEVGAGQAADVQALMDEQGYVGLKVRKDLAGIPRVVWGRTPSRK